MHSTLSCHNVYIQPFCVSMAFYKGSTMWAKKEIEGKFSNSWTLLQEKIYEYKKPLQGESS